MRTASRGGGILFMPDVCPSDAAPYENVAKISLEFLSKHPVDRERCDVCRIADTLLEKNWTLVFQGDSMMRQSFAGLECELIRRGLDVGITRLKSFDTESTAGVPKGAAKWKYAISDKTTVTIKKNNSTARIEFYGMYRPNPISLQQHILDHSDILVFDHSLHYKWLQMDDYKRDMANMLSAVLNHTRLPKLIVWREQSAQHFDAPGGTY
jgi:hypothetical protein